MSINLFNKLEYIDFLICSKSTGKPKELAEKVKVSERALYDMLHLMKNLGAPISYCRQKKTYFYITEGSIKFRFQKIGIEVNMNKVKNQLNKAIVITLFLFNIFIDWDSFFLFG